MIEYTNNIQSIINMSFFNNCHNDSLSLCSRLTTLAVYIIHRLQLYRHYATVFLWKFEASTLTKLSVRQCRKITAFKVGERWWCYLLFVTICFSVPPSKDISTSPNLFVIIYMSTRCPLTFSPPPPDPHTPICPAITPTPTWASLQPKVVAMFQGHNIITLPNYISKQKIAMCLVLHTLDSYIQFFWQSCDTVWKRK